MSEADCGKDGLAAVETNSALPPRAVDFVTVLPSCRSIILRVETMILNTPSLVEKVWDESQAPAGSYQEKTGKKTEHDGFFHMSERLLYTVGSEPKKTPSPWRQQATTKKSIGKRRGDVSQTGEDETLSFDASHMGDTTESRTMVQNSNINRRGKLPTLYAIQAISTRLREKRGGYVLTPSPKMEWKKGNTDGRKWI